MTETRGTAKEWRASAAPGIDGKLLLWKALTAAALLAVYLGASVIAPQLAAGEPAQLEPSQIRPQHRRTGSPSAWETSGRESWVLFLYGQEEDPLLESADWVATEWLLYSGMVEQTNLSFPVQVAATGMDLERLLTDQIGIDLSSRHTRRFQSTVFGQPGEIITGPRHEGWGAIALAFIDGDELIYQHVSTHSQEDLEGFLPTWTTALERLALGEAPVRSEAGLTAPGEPGSDPPEESRPPNARRLSARARARQR